jgi:hypothetical protein
MFGGAPGGRKVSLVHNSYEKSIIAYFSIHNNLCIATNRVMSKLSVTTSNSVLWERFVVA